MKKNIELINGDTTGVTYSFNWFRFEGISSTAPSAYLQAGLHADELPGPAVLHFLMNKLRKAEQDGKVLGQITIVPQANPIGSAQWSFLKLNGRFHSATRENYNRAHPLFDKPESKLAHTNEELLSVDQRLKHRLARLSLGHQIILDLHCDDESLNYVYIAEELWPQTCDLVASLDADAVLLWQGDADCPFEAAALHPYLGAEYEKDRQENIVIATLELRGVCDVNLELAQKDADRIFDFLVARGTIKGESTKTAANYSGPAVPLQHIEMLPAPTSGVIMYHVAPGAIVEEGDKLVTIIHQPGSPEKDVDIFAPQSGLVLTRRSHRYTRAGDDLLKLLGTKPSRDNRQGILEAR
ncbi:succinylglutamate desuccinylase/aspartoacylase domain-containing protein [Polycladidibacter stylochi]|uniref:succinylglutamate desuccinylase/aspartoacylase domain-containing protein n=1 Tax=Polycladidibacter stylochi TaxID=1807766 RepID=UPI00082CF862|nr:succinylglutamate desuccinylase/aspartoacylase family protein [Pseudovibrio stylochi]